MTQVAVDRLRSNENLKSNNVPIDPSNLIDTNQCDLSESQVNKSWTDFEHSCGITSHFLPLTLVVLASLAMSNQIENNKEAGFSLRQIDQMAAEDRQMVDREIPKLSTAEQLRLQLSSFSLVHSLVMFSTILIFGTVLLAILFVKKCFILLRVWIITAYFLVLAPIFMYLLNRTIHGQLAFTIDMLTISVLIWNFAVVGVASVHFHFGPAILSRITIIWLCITFVCLLKMLLQHWLLWMLLVLLIVWDGIAVLAPFGPLKAITDLPTDGEHEIFYQSLAYTQPLSIQKTPNKPNQSRTRSSTSIATNASNDSAGKSIISKKTSDSELQVKIESAQSIVNRKSSKSISTKQTKSQDCLKQADPKQPEEEQFASGDESLEENSLGLGDLVFYSILIHVVFDSNPSWFTLMACYLTLIVGLHLTTWLVIKWNKPLPALPISITLTMLVYFIINTNAFFFEIELQYAIKQIFV